MKGRPVDLSGEHRWLLGPSNHGPLVADSWLTDLASTIGGTPSFGSEDGGILADMARLNGPDFQASALNSGVRNFYQVTSQWDMDVSVRWNPAFKPGGAFISRFFGHRVEQLAIPTATGGRPQQIRSKVVPICDESGSQHAAAWLRTWQTTGKYVYSGCYSVRSLPGARQPCVHVAFPLQAGNVQVFLRPKVLPGGDLHLSSRSGSFGEPGTYVVVEESGRTYAARAPIHEEFIVAANPDGTLRTEHSLRLWSAPVVQLRYRMRHRAG